MTEAQGVLFTTGWMPAVSDVQLGCSLLSEHVVMLVEYEGRGRNCRRDKTVEIKKWEVGSAWYTINEER